MGVRRSVRIAACAAALAGVVGVGAAVTAGSSRNGFRERLTGFEEVPALSTPGKGRFRAFISRSGDEISYRVTFSGLETAITQSHIHFENATNNGNIVVFLCSNVGAPAGFVVQACPGPGATSGTFEGTLQADDVTALAAAQGIAAGEFDEFVRAIRADATYVNIHTTGRPGGEIRAQLD
jgi:CHRD domain